MSPAPPPRAPAPESAPSAADSSRATPALHVESPGARPDPVRDLAWPPERARELADVAVGLWTELLERLPRLPVARRLTVDQVRRTLTLPIPDDPMPLHRLEAHLRELVFENATYTGHPGFIAYVTGAATVPGAAADLIAAGFNQNLGGWRLSPGATEIELHLMRWLAGRIGLPEGAGGVVTMGGAVAAFTGLKAGLQARAGWDVRTRGVAAGPPLAVYASSEIHDVNVRAADMLGLGTEAVRRIAVDRDQRLRMDLLREAVEADVRAGVRPLAVVASAGTVATGSIDPLDEIADFCAERGLWFQIDGAYGGVAALTGELRPLFCGIERADAIVLDPHKWLYTPQSGGAILVREFDLLRRAFDLHPSYTREDKELTGRGIDLYEVSPNFSRGFHALKIWVSLLAHGWSAYERRIAHDVRLTRYLHERVLGHPELEPVGPPPVLSITCFRYVPPDLRGDASADPYVDALNERLMAELQMGGRVFPSNAVIEGRYALRSCIVNYRTEADDLDALVDGAVELGRRLDGEMRRARSD